MMVSLVLMGIFILAGAVAGYFVLGGAPFAGVMQLPEVLVPQAKVSQGAENQIGGYG